MIRHYLSVYQWLKERNFEVWVPAFFQTNLPEDMVNPKPVPLEPINQWKMVTTNRKNPLPFRQMVDPNQPQRAAYSVEVLLGMFQKKIEFTIANEDDVVEIFDGLDRYLLSLQADFERGDERIGEYVRLVVSWRSEVYKHYYRYMKTHPAALEKLYPNNDPKKNLLSMMAGISGVREEYRELDPLRARARPPYPIDVVPSAARESNLSSDEFMQSSLGLSKGNPMYQDDGKDFNFDDFLKR